MSCKDGQFDIVELMLKIGLFKHFSIDFAKNQPFKIGLEEIEKL